MTHGEPTNPTVVIDGVEASLLDALAEGQLYLDYQPKISLKTRRIAGVEAFVRWRHPAGKSVSPGLFIPAAEKAGLMPQITDAILDMALAEVRGWRRKGFEVPVAVNVTTSDLLKPGFVSYLESKLAEHRTPASHLTLEITEAGLGSDFAEARRVMVEVSRLGVHLALDDYGIGMSSLFVLRSLPISEVKLDREFVSIAVESDDDRALVTKVIELCHVLNLSVVGEGVETDQLLDRLTHLGCDDAQGWYVGKPMSPDEVMVWSADYLRANDLGDLLPHQGGVLTSAASAAAALAALADSGPKQEEAPGKVYSLEGEPGSLADLDGLFTI